MRTSETGDERKEIVLSKGRTVPSSTERGWLKCTSPVNVEGRESSESKTKIRLENSEIVPQGSL